MKTITRLFLKLLFIGLLAMPGVLAAAEGPATFKVGDLTFTRPEKWEWIAVNQPMRKAQLKAYDADRKESAEAVFFQFGPGSGGGVQANIDRWFGQFEEAKDKINAKTEDVTVGKTKITYVQAEGTYKSGMPGAPLTPMKDYALIGAIIQVAPDDNIFVRMTGPKPVVKASFADFRKMIESGPKKN